jgi:hypothetical protein
MRAWALQQRWPCTRIPAPLAPNGAEFSHSFKASIRAILLGRYAYVVERRPKLIADSPRYILYILNLFNLKIER